MAARRNSAMAREGVPESGWGEPARSSFKIYIPIQGNLGIEEKGLNLHCHWSVNRNLPFFYTQTDNLQVSGNLIFAYKLQRTINIWLSCELNPGLSLKFTVGTA